MPPVVFLLASLVLAATPGPGVVFIVTHTLAQGRRAGLACVAGVALGNLGNAVGAALGLAALFTLWPAAFMVVRLAGAAYLVWLGIHALRSKTAPDGPAGTPPAQLRRIIRDGFVVALLNPKTALFFAAFLPQFIEPAASALRQSLLFGATFVAIAAATDAIYAVAASAIAPRLARTPNAAALARRASAAVFIGLGLLAALAGSRMTK